MDRDPGGRQSTSSFPSDLMLPAAAASLVTDGPAAVLLRPLIRPLQQVTAGQPRQPSEMRLIILQLYKARYESKAKQQRQRPHEHLTPKSMGTALHFKHNGLVFAAYRTI